MSGISSLPDHVTGDQFTEEMWTAIEDNVNDGIVTQLGTEVHRTGDKTISAGGSANIDFDNVDYDVDGMFDLASPTRLTVKTAGWYMVAGHLSFSADTSGTSREANLVVNGTDYIARGGRTPRGGGNVTTVTATTVYYFNVGDYVELHANWDATSSGTANSTAKYGNYLRMVRL